MKNKRRSILFAGMAATVLTAAGCQTAPPTNTNFANTSVVNSAIAGTSNSTANTATAPATNTASTTALTSSSTPTEVYKAAYRYRQNKDVEGLKKIFSKDVLEFLTLVAEEEKKTLDDQLRDLTEQPQYSTDESRNEKITGDRATIEYRDQGGTWRTMDFVMEDGMWKMSLPGGGPDSEKKGAKNP